MMSRQDLPFAIHGGHNELIGPEFLINGIQKKIIYMPQTSSQMYYDQHGNSISIKCFPISSCHSVPCGSQWEPVTYRDPSPAGSLHNGPSKVPLSNSYCISTIPYSTIMNEGYGNSRHAMGMIPVGVCSTTVPVAHMPGMHSSHSQHKTENIMHHQHDPNHKLQLMQPMNMQKIPSIASQEIPDLLVPTSNSVNHIIGDCENLTDSGGMSFAPKDEDVSLNISAMEKSVSTDLRSFPRNRHTKGASKRRRKPSVEPITYSASEELPLKNNYNLSPSAPTEYMEHNSCQSSILCRKSASGLNRRVPSSCSRPSKYFRQRASMAAAAGISLNKDANWSSKSASAAAAMQASVCGADSDIASLSRRLVISGFGGSESPPGGKCKLRGRSSNSKEVMAKMYFHRKKEAWRAEILIGGAKKQKSFSCRLYGHDRARLMCEWARRFVLHTSRLPTDEETCASLAVLMDCSAVDNSLPNQRPVRLEKEVKAPSVDGSKTERKLASNSSSVMPSSHALARHTKPEPLCVGRPGRPRKKAATVNDNIDQSQLNRTSSTADSQSSATGNSEFCENLSESTVRNVTASPLSPLLSSGSSLSAPDSPGAIKKKHPSLPPAKTDLRLVAKDSVTRWEGRSSLAIRKNSSLMLNDFTFPVNDTADFNTTGNSQLSGEVGKLEPPELQDFDELLSLRKLTRPKGSRAKRFNVGKKPFSGVRGIYFQQGLWKVKYKGETEESVKLFPYTPGETSEMKAQFTLAREFLRQVIEKGRHLHESDGDGLSETEPAWLVRSNSCKNVNRKEITLSPCNEQMRVKALTSGRRRNRTTPLASAKVPGRLQTKNSISSAQDDLSGYRRLLTMLPRQVELATVLYKPVCGSKFFSPIFQLGKPQPDWGPRYDGIKEKVEGKRNQVSLTHNTTECFATNSTSEADPRINLLSVAPKINPPSEIILNAESKDDEKTDGAITATVEAAHCPSQCVNTDTASASVVKQNSEEYANDATPTQKKSYDYLSNTLSKAPYDQNFSVATWSSEEGQFKQRLYLATDSIQTGRHAPVHPRRHSRRGRIVVSEQDEEMTIPLTPMQLRLAAYPWNLMWDFWGAADEDRRLRVLEDSLTAVGKLEEARAAVKSIYPEPQTNHFVTLSLKPSSPIKAAIISQSTS